ncbi:LacI family transcriptional regulator [Planotetraspora thailandica]|uniref:LacI family transcriptional regulator n=1 Tax=Planotetraspora thailandica TaxID=487172 RepID=A0A8J3UXJ6_9ACTN|nr:LacI family DNA-binding transcriptional regulator [Planotetraspora thailandica]GII51687.1 LacI family transcriptional regulator [Planotetraspora thailandica]
MTRLADVARAAGVSMSTASRALSRPDLVASDTRMRVLDAVQRLGFQVNPAARALTSGKTGLLAMCVPTLSNPYFAPIIAGAQQTAEAADRHLTVVVTEGSARREAEVLARVSRQVDGFIIVAPRGGDADLLEFGATTPAVIAERVVPGLASVVIDTPAGLRDLMNVLKADGHRRIAYLSGPAGSWMDALRCDALRDSLGDGGELSVIGPLPPTFRAGVEAVEEILERRATAVVAYNSLLAVGAVYQLRNVGVRVPDDVSVASADDLAALGLGAPEITTLHFDPAALGAAGVDMLVQLIDGREPEVPHVRIPAHLRVRSSEGWAAAEG